MRIESLCHEAGIILDWCPFLLGPIFKSQGWDSSPFNIYPAKGEYMQRDMSRLAEKHELPAFVMPPKFPQHSVIAARIGIIARDEGWVGDYSKAIFSRQFVEAKDIHDDASLYEILEDLGKPASEVLARSKTDQILKDRLKIATDTAVEIGIFGAPSFVTENGELFWGDDRLEDAIEWVSREN